MSELRVKSVECPAGHKGTWCYLEKATSFFTDEIELAGDELVIGISDGRAFDEEFDECEEGSRRERYLECNHGIGENFCGNLVSIGPVIYPIVEAIPK